MRVRWWNAAYEALLDAEGIDVEFLLANLAERVPLPTQDEELTYIFWAQDAPWRRAPDPTGHRERLARAVRSKVLDCLRPGDDEWERAIITWSEADEAYTRGDWKKYVELENRGLELAAEALRAASRKNRCTGAHVEMWTSALQDHVRRLEVRRAAREEEQARRSAEEERRREREAAKERRREAEEARRRSSRNAKRPRPARPQSIVDRMNYGSPDDWASFLGIIFPCTRDELKQAHRAAVRRHHPDLGGDAEMMKAVNIAKERLDDILAFFWTAQDAN